MSGQYSPGAAPAPRVTLAHVAIRAWTGADPTLVLDDLSLTLRAGERVRVIGDRASGKSTLLRVVAGICPVSSGSRATTVPALPLLGNGSTYDGTLSIDDNIRLHLVSWRRRAATPFAAFSGAARTMAGLGEPGGLRPEQIPAREQIRLIAAAALQTRPQLLVVDEIDEKLDPDFASWVRPHIDACLPADGILVAAGSWTMSREPLFGREITLRGGRVVSDRALGPGVPPASRP